MPASGRPIVEEVFFMSVFAACTLGFGIVLLLLTFMAVVMAILTRIFPSPALATASSPIRIDPGIESAISQAVNSAFPGAQVSHIRELPR